MPLKSVQWQTSCSMRAGGRTDRRADMTKLEVTFHDFANAPNDQPALHDAKQAIRLFRRPWKLPAV
jgi:hypothetical protein